MKVLVLATLLCATAAMAEPLPQPYSGGSCPNGYIKSGGTCIANNGPQTPIREIW
jgi:hypothetical protein